MKMIDQIEKFTTTIEGVDMKMKHTNNDDLKDNYSETYSLSKNQLNKLTPISAKIYTKTLHLILPMMTNILYCF